MDLDLKNPFRDAKIVSVDTDKFVYLRQDHPRGNPNFVMSNSALSLFAECPNSWVLGKGEEGTDATEWGDLIDCKVLCPQRFDQYFAMKPDTYPDSKTGEQKPWSGNAKFCREWKQEQIDAGRVVISRNDELESNKAVWRLFNDPYVPIVLERCRKQIMVVGIYFDRATGLEIPVKACLDCVPTLDNRKYHRDFFELKTARSASPRAWRSQVAKLGYHCQAAFHSLLYLAAEKEDRVSFRHIISENVMPYEVGRRTLSLEFYNSGYNKILGNLQRYAQCLKQQAWPSYDDIQNDFDGFPLCEPPKWLDSDFEEEPEPDYAERPKTEVNIDEVIP